MAIAAIISPNITGKSDEEEQSRMLLSYPLRASYDCMSVRLYNNQET